MNNDKVYEQVNERIIALLEQGVSPWRKPWKSENGKIEVAKNLISKKPYRGCNFFIVNSMGYSSPYWLTFNQAKQKGGNVKKGEKGTLIVFWKTFSVSETNEKSETKNKDIPFLRTSYIFNVQQCENLKVEEEPKIDLVDHNPIESCENALKKFPLGMPELRHVQDRAFYSPSQDYINMPKMGLFESGQEYYHTLFHESIHATGHKSRLNRQTLTDIHYFGDANYSQEELVAEMGASYMSALCGIDNVTIQNSASYLSNWIAAIRKDNKLVLKAASQAQKAVDFLTGYQYTEESENE